ncbi:MAG TPA: 2-succinyl-5-enolpyruvyl-6-hydroxy-3-cyclohexene-1-carboxylic-acid synthase [Kofleriaceae bacterium]|nr:2-succinyl-5-enolpyruvyl-6-hydroxy-3-cyclohexene-1-carboxylic-acid synthase [Kofleriaceae bacterium]
MSTAAVQTLWAELIAATLADAGVTTCVVSPGSRSTPLVMALAADGRFELPTIIDERAAAFFALGLARASIPNRAHVGTNTATTERAHVGKSRGVTPVAIVCTSGSAAAHYLPALVEARMSGIPLIAITADRPPELQDCGASQTIDQVGLYGSFVNAAFDLGPPTGSALAMRAVRRKVLQAVTAACGPRPGPVQLEVPLRKPLEPAAPSTDDERALAKVVAELRGKPVMVAPPRLVADASALDALAAAIAAEPKGVIVAGAMPVSFAKARDAVFALAARAGYPILAEAGSQLRFCSSPAGVTMIDHFDLVLAAKTLAPEPKLVIQIGAEPVGAAWSTAFAGAQRWVLADHDWHDADSTAHGVIVGDVASSFATLDASLSSAAPSLAEPHVVAFAAAWAAAEARVVGAVNRALASHPRSEGAVLRAVLEALPATVAIQIGNSLPIRVVDQVCSSTVDRRVLTQRGAAGIDGLIASAAGATRAGAPVLLVLGDVSFAHDVGGLLATREAAAPLAILVLDNGGGRIFDGLPVAKSNVGAAPTASFARHFTTAPQLDPAAVALVLGAQAITAASPAAAAAAVAAAFAKPGVTVIHAPVTPTGAHDVRRDVLELVPTERGTGRAASGPLAVGARHG